MRASPITRSVGETVSSSTLCGQAELSWEGTGTHGSCHGRWSTSEENWASATHAIIRLLVRAGCHGQVDGKWMAPPLSPPHASAKLNGVESKQGSLVGSLQANQKPCQQPPASAAMVLSPHLPSLSGHAAMPPELSQLSVATAGLVTDPKDWRPLAGGKLGR